MTPLQTQKLLRTLSDEEAEVFAHDWEQVWARDEQLEPPGDWLLWLIMTGRGWGKTRTGAEWSKHQVLSLPYEEVRWALVAETFGDGRDTMVEGESGLLSILAPSQLRGGTVDTAWNRSMGELFLSNGARFKIYSSEKPGQLRGPQHHGGWGDEVAKWKDANQGDQEDTTHSNLLFGLRLGERPRLCYTTTPKRVKLLVGTKTKPGLVKQDTTVVTRGRTRDNLRNLSEFYTRVIIPKYKGTRTGRQELEGELLEEVEGALWMLQQIEEDRIDPKPVKDLELVRVIVAVDPAVSDEDNEDADEVGIVVAGKGADGRGYLLADRSIQGVSPLTWAKRVVQAYDDFQADLVVAETNNGGELVRINLRAVRRHLPVKKVTASRGKMIRAEPVSSLSEQHLISHVGFGFDELEEQLTTWTQESGESPGRLDAYVWAFTELFNLSNDASVASGTVSDQRLRGTR